MFCSEIFFRTTRELEYFFSPEFSIRLYDKYSESDYFFVPPPKSEYFFVPPPKPEYFFQQHWESEYFFRKKTYPPPLQIKWSVHKNKNSALTGQASGSSGDASIEIEVG